MVAQGGARQDQGLLGLSLSSPLSFLSLSEVLIVHSGAGLPNDFPSHLDEALGSSLGFDLLSDEVVLGVVSAGFFAANEGVLKERHEMSAIETTGRRI